jgi:hypothetical protein
MESYLCFLVIDVALVCCSDVNNQHSVPDLLKLKALMWVVLSSEWESEFELKLECIWS